MLNMRQKQALTQVVRKRYHQATKSEKTKILTEFIANTHYNRSYARRLLSKRVKTETKKRLKFKLRQREYDGEVIKVLTKIWIGQDTPCGKRLQPFLPELVRVLCRDQEIKVSALVKTKLLKISAATIDRVLSPTKKKLTLKGKSLTKPGTLLKSQIAIRTFNDWDDLRPGFMEVDSVAFCGATLLGHHIWGLNLTDVSTGWVGLGATMGKGQFGIHEATKEIKVRLPFKMLGFDSDNGSEFINDIMRRFCESEQITFTRIRPTKKNDNCYVEQKNYTVLRNFLGYSRYDTPEELIVIKELLPLVELYVNFFQPSQKLKSKVRIKAKVHKSHDKAKTPYQRLLKTGILTKEQRQKLHQVYNSHNPMELLRKIRVLQNKLEQLNRYKLDEATNT